jgi:hypothetical protein
MNIYDPDLPPHVYFVTLEVLHEGWSILRVCTLYYDAQFFLALAEEQKHTKPSDFMYHIRAYQLDKEIESL